MTDSLSSKPIVYVPVPTPGWPSELVALRHYHDSLREIERLRAVLADKQARIDALMLEYCPDEMTAEQTAEWARNQVRADETLAALADTVRAYLRASDECVAQAVTDEPWREAHARQEALRQRLEELLQPEKANDATRS